MKFSRKIILCLAALFSYSFGLERVPDFLHVCHKSDPNLADCIIKSVEFLRPYLAAGIPEMGIPPIEPLDVGTLLVSENTASNGLRITTKDIQSYGSSSFIINKLEVVEYGQQYHLDLALPHIYATGIYTVNGQILVLPIRGTGSFSGNFTNCIGSTNIFFNRNIANENDHVLIKKIEIKIQVGKGSIKLNNLFNGDRNLGDAINDVINQNFEIVSADVIPLIENALQRTFKKTLNKIVSRFTNKQLFPQT